MSHPIPGHDYGDNEYPYEGDSESERDYRDYKASTRKKNVKQRALKKKMSSKIHTKKKKHNYDFNRMK